jgi:hypothetical protein
MVGNVKESQKPTYFSAYTALYQFQQCRPQNVSLTHGNLAYERPDVDQKVITHVYSRVCNCWIDNDPFSIRLGANESSRVTGLVLLCDEWGNCTFEKPSTDGQYPAHMLLVWRNLHAGTE